MKPIAIMVDIDGTLAHRVDRSPYDMTRVIEDTCDENVRSVVNLLGNNVEVFVLSGRSDICKNDTKKWLDDNRITYDKLFMRKDGDNRADEIVKQEIFEKYIKPNYDVLCVLDDRNKVVNMWRSIGLKCLQVQNGDF